MATIPTIVPKIVPAGLPNRRGTAPRTCPERWSERSGSFRGQHPRAYSRTRVIDGSSSQFPVSSWRWPSMRSPSFSPPSCKASWPGWPKRASIRVATRSRRRAILSAITDGGRAESQDDQSAAQSDRWRGRTPKFTGRPPKTWRGRRPRPSL